MALEICCPKCKLSLKNINDTYICSKCDRIYPVRDGYIDLIEDSEFYAGEVSKQQMHVLLNDIDSLGYAEGLSRFLKNNPFLKGYLTDDRRIDWAYHCLTKNNHRCLDIGSGLGNISEGLSHMFQEAYSLEAVKERIEFQKRRFKDSKRTNIKIIRGNALELPFPDNYFDLVVCNGVLEWVGMMNTDIPPNEAQLAFLREVKRTLSDNGCFYIGIENRIGLPFLLGQKDHSGLPFTSLLPRSIASLVVKKFGFSGGIYGDKSDGQKEKRGYHTYTYSIWGYQKLLQMAGFRFKSFWVFPSYNEPYFSGRLDDKVGLKGFVHYFKNTAIRSRTLLSLVNKLGGDFISLISKLFSPSFLFYCYKIDPTESLDENIINNTHLTHYTTISETSSLMYLLYDNKGNPKKVVRVKRRGSELTSVIPFYDKSSPSLHQSTERIWIEDWISGRKLNPLRYDEMQMAIDWLITFQNNSRQGIMTEEDIMTEVNELKNNLSQIPDLNTEQTRKWLDDYQSYSSKLKLNRTSEHGDFWQGNILIDDNAHKLTVIDWEHFRKEGNPFYDFIFLIVNAMLLNNDRREFQSNLKGIGKFSPIMKELRNKINVYFNCELDLIILIRYVILRFLVRKYRDSNQYDETIVLFKKLLLMLQ